ncbi:hypothetical protein AY600_09395 [Phormidium willei BDU 130791]|nr:hypothetical protein AY600_09395 [Phormidium willei BDU 130791]
MQLSFLRAVVAAGAMTTLTGCAGLMLGDAQNLEPAGTPFQNALYGGYVDLAMAEYDEGDYGDSDFFSGKAMAAAGGQAVGPQPLAERRLPAGSEGELADARARLVAALDGPARGNQPDLAAEAQTAFDCWLQEQEENYQPDHIAACREAFEAAMAQLAPAQPMAFAPRDFTVYFATDSAALTGSAQEMVRQAADVAKANPGTRVEVVGHTDTAGSAAYNARLSEARATAVKQALMELGVAGGRVVMDATGERNLAEATPDGTENRLNRRVTLTITR